MTIGYAIRNDGLGYRSVNDESEVMEHEYFSETEPEFQQEKAMNTMKLQQLNQLAAAQKNALTNRVSTLNDAVELEMATPAEIAELPVRTAQLKAWKTYAVYLGRVTQQAGWAVTVDWPVQPLEGMDLTTNAARPVQAS